METRGKEAEGLGETVEFVRINELLSEASGGLEVIGAGDGTFRRSRFQWSGGDALCDTFGAVDGACLFVRTTAGAGRSAVLELEGTYGLERCKAGGWLLSASDAPARYWVPQRPMVRCVDEDNHILQEEPAPLVGMTAGSRRTQITFRVPGGKSLEFSCWRLFDHDDGSLAVLAGGGTELEPPFFLWGSHTTLGRPADLYRHLIHGRIYEDRYQWPKQWRICSENDAHALYVILTGLSRQRGGALYDMMRRQVVFSVVARQCSDGAWRHGEWTDRMECHCRLHCSAMHLLMDYLDEYPDGVVRGALRRAAEYVTGIRDRMEAGAWFLHDELETDTGRMERSPFRWIRSRAFGKSESNMLVINTHVDTSIALARSDRTQGEAQYEGILASADDALTTVLSARPAQWIYRPLWSAIALSLLPTDRGAALPLYLRAVKRLGWKYIAPRFHRIKARFPRLVMPGGHIERALTLQGVDDRYLSINLMDLARYQRSRRNSVSERCLVQAIEFADRIEIGRQWAQAPGTRYAMGFWLEMLYHLCMQDPAMIHRARLARAMTMARAAGVGQAPSLLGANAEAVHAARQAPCPLAESGALQVANLSDGDWREYLVVNSGTEESPIEWIKEPEVGDGAPAEAISSGGESVESLADRRLAVGDWVIIRAGTGSKEAG